MAARARFARKSLAWTTLALTLGVGCGESPPPPPTTPAPTSTPERPAATAAPTTTAEAKPTPEPSISLEQLLDVNKSAAPSAIDAERFVYLSDAPGTAQIFAPPEKGASGPKATPTQLTSYADRVAGLHVLPDGKRALFLKDSGGDENDQIFLLDLSGATEPVALTDAPKVKHSLPTFNEEGSRIAYTSNARNGKDMDLYVDALPAPAKRPTAKGPPKPAEKSEKPAALPKKTPLVELSGSYAAVDFRGDKILVVETRSSFDDDLWIVDAKTKKKTLLTKHTGDERWDQARFSRDGKAVLTTTDAGREYLSLVAIDVASGKRTPILELENDIESAAFAPPSAPAKGAKDSGAAAGDVVVYTVNKDGIEELMTTSIDASRKAAPPKALGLKGVFSTLDVAPGGAAAFVSLERASMPTEVFRADLAAGTAARVTFSNHAGIDESKLVNEELLSAPSFDKKPISFFWYKAPSSGSEKLPVILMIHGGPEGQWQPGWNAPAQYFALHGYAVAAPNVRGSMGYGKSFAHLDDKEKREDSVKDMSEIGKALAARPDVDGSKLVLYGGSYGGYMVLAGLTLFPEQWAAGVDIVGIANFRSFLEQTAPYRRALREAEYGSLAADGAFLDRVSPISRVDKIRAPLMVIHGTRDPRVPIGEARQIAEAVKKRGLPVELLTFDDEGHGLQKRKNRLIAYPKVATFLDTYVKNRKP